MRANTPVKRARKYRKLSLSYPHLDLRAIGQRAIEQLNLSFAHNTLELSA